MYTVDTSLLCPKRFRIWWLSIRNSHQLYLKVFLQRGWCHGCRALVRSAMYTQIKCPCKTCRTAPIAYAMMVLQGHIDYITLRYNIPSRFILSFCILCRSVKHRLHISTGESQGKGGDLRSKYDPTLTGARQKRMGCGCPAQRGGQPWPLHHAEIQLKQLVGRPHAKARHDVIV